MWRMPSAHMLRAVLVFMYWCSLRAVLVFICTGVHFVLSLLVPTALHSQRSESEQRNQEGGSEAGAAMDQDPGVGLHADVQADHSNQLPRAAGAHWPESRQHALVLLPGFLSNIAALHVQTYPSHVTTPYAHMPPCEFHDSSTARIAVTGHGGAGF